MVADADGNSSAIDQTRDLTSSLQPLTCSHFSLSRRDRSRLPRGDVFILPTQVKWKYDSMDVAHALNPMQQTQTAARKSLPTQPRRMRGKPGISFWNEVTEGKDAVMANGWFVS